MENMTLFDLGKQVPDCAKKEIRDGRLKGKTDIAPMWRIQKLTEMFGPCGIGWWTENITHRLEPGANGEIKAFAELDLKYVYEGQESKPIHGIGGSSFVAKERNGPYTSDECFKMAETDALSVACKMLGIGADVYMSGYDSKYQGRGQPEGPQVPQQGLQPPPPPPQGGLAQTYQQVKQQAPAPQQTAYFVCEDCGARLVPYPGTDGRQVSLRAHAERSRQLYGRVLCLNCMSLQNPNGGNG